MARNPSLNQAREPSRSVRGGRTESAMRFPAHSGSPLRSQRLRICEVHPELRLRCDACPGAGYANGAEIPRLLWLPPIIRSVRSEATEQIEPVARLDDVTLHGRDPIARKLR